MDFQSRSVVLQHDLANKCIFTLCKLLQRFFQKTPERISGHQCPVIGQALMQYFKQSTLFLFTLARGMHITKSRQNTDKLTPFMVTLFGAKLYFTDRQVNRNQLSVFMLCLDLSPLANDLGITG